ncbi:hypothetical protein McpAg1_02300 [Methanocorpusculaceae archaeon Ag1]|uniref:Uncharacterized protein n=1 Tax=Methanorbis furvi TaxID=3028299 RepID=A0AAE4S9E0_9EURY|nr:hypothetical protein [Methanocorpusculaceae archaeon Ag1]
MNITEIIFSIIFVFRVVHVYSVMFFSENVPWAELPYDQSRNLQKIYQLSLPKYRLIEMV